MPASIRNKPRPLVPYLALAIAAFVAGMAFQPNAGILRGPAVTGIGGIFFKSTDPNALRDWYREHLGVDAADWGGYAFRWSERDQPDEIGYTVWGVFRDSTRYFGDGPQSYMINYRVNDLDGLIANLTAAGVEVAGETGQHPNGKFAWIVDLEGRRVELWEPVPSADDPYLD